jgi:hypothetical protein
VRTVPGGRRWTQRQASDRADAAGARSAPSEGGVMQRFVVVFDPTVEEDRDLDIGGPHPWGVIDLDHLVGPQVYGWYMQAGHAAIVAAEQNAREA